MGGRSSSGSRGTVDIVEQYKEKVKQIQNSSKRHTKLQNDVITSFIKFKKYPEDDWRKQSLDAAISKWEQHQEALRKQRDLAKRVRRGEATWLDE